MDKTGRYALIAVVVATALWGFGGVLAGRLFGQGVAPLEVVALRTWVALAGLAALLAWRRPKRPAGPFPWRAVIGFGLSAAVANAGLFLAISRLPVAVALVLQNLAPAFVIGWRLLRPRMLACLAASLLGVALVVELPTAPLGGIDLLGVGFGLLTAAGVAAFSVFGSKAGQACGALTANACAFLASSIVWMLYQIPRGEPEVFHHPGALGAVAIIGLFGTLAPFLLYSWGSTHIGPAVSAVNISLEPLFGAALAWIWLGQTVKPIQSVGAVILLAAVIQLQGIRGRSTDPGIELPDPDRRPVLTRT
jgi:drug/metabolite transporter (DMT)-like permease